MPEQFTHLQALTGDKSDNGRSYIEFLELT